MEDDTRWWQRLGQRELREGIRQNNLMYGGLVGVALIMVQPFLTTGLDGLSATICVFAFAAAVPLLAALILITEQEKFRGRPSNSRFVEVIRSLAVLASLIGLAAGFWHMSWIAGVIVLVSIILGVAAHSAGYTRVEEASEAEPGEAESENAEDQG
ncbi:hypothetical protein [Microlunatus sp. GCM10028923]|uniref:hypothetical protein n=1 Tax=Microlunatus sp. GCM10028923 TaxID=3273400 RepID=UPI00361669AA